MAISCAYCGGAHERVDEVRACWQRSQRRPVAAHVTAGVTAGVTTGVGPGPAALGRHVVVLPGQDAPVAWEGAERIVVDHRALQAPDQVLPRLRRAAVARERLVLEVHPGVENPPASVEHRPPYELGPRFSFPLDELHHLVWSNAVDARSGRNSWWLVEAAVAAGARAGGSADVVLPSGEPAWLDGGSLRFSGRLDGAGVLSAVAVEHGSLVPFGHNTPGADLAPDQLAAVTHPGGAARIIAPAGSGKTRVLTERARHLRQAWNLPSGAVSLVAFNRRAQQEMAVRTTDIERLQVRTLNAIALAIVNGSRPFAPRSMTRRTIEEVDVRRMLGRLVEVPARRNQDPFAPWIEALGMIRLGLLPPEIVEERYDGDVAGLTAVWPRYREMLDREGLVDFDHQVYLALEVLLTDPEARRVAQRACRVLLVDEFQDLTPAHVLLVRLLAGPQGHVFGVGDDDQTIYGYNGADPAWLIDFAELFPGAGDHPLEVNYRCPADVVLGADRLLRHNRRRVPKTIRAAREGTTGLHVVPVEDTVAAAVEAVRDALARGRTPEQVAVLTRVNALLAPVQVALGAVGVPVTGGVGTNFVEQVSIRAVLAWLRLAAEPAKLRPDDLAEALRRPSRPLHPRVADWVQEQTSIAGLRRLAGRVKTERDATRLAEFAADIDRLASLVEAGASTARVVRTLIDDVGLGGAVATLDRTRHGMNRASQGDDLSALIQLATMHREVATFESWLRDVLGRPGRADGVTLATVHRVKGQEWPVVVVHQATADQFPHRLADNIEEERRLFHVAITRGADEVVVVVGEPPNPFVAQLTSEPPAVAEREARRDLSASAASRLSGRRSRVPMNDPAERLAARDVVLAAPGLVLVDGGQEWTVIEVGEDGVVAVHGAARWRFPFGAQVVTAGRQRGVLARPEPGIPPAAIRAYDSLRQWRESVRQGKPAYVVFDDATLARIAGALPVSLDELARVKGVGPLKLDQYGDAVLAVIEDPLGWEEDHRP